MIDLNDLRSFVNVVHHGGLTAAGRALGLPKSTISHRLRQLEGALGARLLNRSSRSLSMTDAGTQFYHHAIEALDHAGQAERSVRERLSEPSGTLRITTETATSIFALRPILPAFLRRYPAVNIVLDANDDQADLIADNYDLAIRAHRAPLANSDLIQRALTAVPWKLFAAPAYLASEPTIADPADLAGHQTVAFACGGPREWRMSHAYREEVGVPLSPRMVCNDLLTLRHAAAEGIGIAALPAYVCREELRSGTLAPVLPEWTAIAATITVVMPSRLGMLPSARAFIAHLAKELPEQVKQASCNPLNEAS